MVSAQAAYASAAAGSYGPPECLASPAQPGCIPRYPANGPAFLDPELAAASVRNGYRLEFVAGAARPTVFAPSGIAGYCYGAVPVNRGQTGVRSFAADQSGRICFDSNAGDLCAPGYLPRNCEALR
jgi:hypothetical protein